MQHEKGMPSLSSAVMMHVIQNSTQGIMVTDAARKILWVNSVFENVTQYSLSEIQGHSPAILRSGRHAVDFYGAMYARIEADGHWHGEVWNRKRGGELYPQWLHISRVYDSQGALTHYVGVFSDLSSQKENEARMEYLACHDSLTGLPNRRHFYEQAGLALKIAPQGEATSALFLVSLDRFRRINESFGFAIGDQVLKQIADVLRMTLRPDDFLARLEADTFVILARGLRSPVDAQRIAGKLQLALAEIRTIQGEPVVLTSSIGTALAPHDGDELDTLIMAADAALNVAKNEGRNCQRFYGPDMGMRSYAHLVLEGHMRNSLEAGDFLLHYQPKVDLQSGALHGVEALIRWNHPERGLVSPAEFIPLAESTGLILPLGEWVIRHACHDAVRWRQHSGRDDLRIAVNVSPAQFGDPALVRRIRSIVEETGLPPAMLEIEVTESSIMGALERTIAILHELKAIGVRIAVDDFGTGYSSLAYLKHFPIDTLKIDRSFVRDLETAPHDRAIASTIVALGHSLGLDVVAEGVETARQIEILLELGCDQVQGYHIARPLPFAALLEFSSPRAN